MLQPALDRGKWGSWSSPLLRPLRPHCPRPLRQLGALLLLRTRIRAARTVPAILNAFLSTYMKFLRALIGPHQCLSFSMRIDARVRGAVLRLAHGLTCIRRVEVRHVLHRPFLGLLNAAPRG
jgi:hypothetical protein